MLFRSPLQHYDDYKIKAAEKSAAAARGSMYPTLSAYGSLGSNYNNQAQQLLGFSQTTINNVPIGSVNVGGTSYNVVTSQTINSPNYSKRGFTNQLQDNFRQSIGLSVSVPIFSGGNLRTNYERSVLNTSSLQLQKMQDDQKLKQDIYSAYNAALIALEKFNASEKSVLSNQKTFDFANKRFNVGMLGTFDLISTQNNLLRAKLEYSLNQFDYVFKMKVLEFHKGLGLKL